MLSLHPAFLKLLRDDRRYPSGAYVFVFETLEYAQNVLKLGIESETEPLSPGMVADRDFSENETESPDEAADEGEVRQSHVTGQDLCRAAICYALDQYGLLARTVLAFLGIRSTGDIGNIVYNLMSIALMRKTPQDRREDFDDVFDFDTVFDQAYSIGRADDDDEAPRE